MDPQLRLLMEVTWEALEDSFINPQNLSGTNTGIFVGAWRKEYQSRALLSPEKDFFSVYMGHSMSARLSFFLETTGPALDTETACSSSIVAVDLACKSLRNGTTNLAIVGGVNLLTEPPFPTFLDVSFATSDDAKCKPFDASADGYGIAEGCGVIILKRLSDSLKNGDRILALIKGSGVTQEGLSRSIGTPTIHSEALAMSLALNDAKVDPKDVSYIEAHGTGTKVGDPIEIKAIEKVYGSQKRRNSLIIGTVKANFGHCESASGIAGIIKVVLALQNEIIPKHINFTKLNPEINLDAIPAILPMENMIWPRNSKTPRIAGVSSHGISGTDGHCIIQEAPVASKDIPNFSKALRSMSIIVISAKTDIALQRLQEKYENFLEKSTVSFHDIAFTANTSRTLFDHRLTLVASNNLEALGKLRVGKYQRKHVPIVREKPKVCFLFPGQGSQYKGMARELYLHSPVFKCHFDKCCKILEGEHIDLKSIIWGDNQGQLLNENSPVAIVCVNYCLFKVWESWGIKPHYVLGHSLGESSAAIAYGAHDLETGLKSIVLRSRIVKELAKGKMIALKVNQSRAEALVKEFLSNEGEDAWLDEAATNSPEQTVLSGRSDVVENFHSFCKGKGVKAVIIASSHAFHSRALDPALGMMREGIEGILEHNRLKRMESSKNSNKESSIKYISSSEARIVQDEELLEGNYWVNSSRKTVKFMDACGIALEECRIFIEVGARPILSSLIKVNCKYMGIDPNQVICLSSLESNQNDWENILNSLGQLAMTSLGNEIDWNKFNEPYGPRTKVPLPFHPFIRRSFWIDIDASVMNYDNDVKKVLHPLIGRKIENATKTIIFENRINLNQKAHEYLNDHKIGGHTIFPGAGFLEATITSAILSVGANGNSNEFIIQNLKIQSPLKLQIDKPCILQTIIGEPSNERFNIDIYSKGKNSWTKHCQSLYVPKIDSNNSMQYPNSFNLEHLWKNFEVENAHFIETFYQDDLVNNNGLLFGNFFQTLKNVWRNTDEDQVLVSITLAGAIENYSSYFPHPLLLDAMIQSTLVTLPKESLHVPVGIDRFVLIIGKDKPLSKEYYALCTSRTDKDLLFDIFLLDESGNTLAIIEGLQMYCTTVAKIEQNLQLPTREKKEEDDQPQLWEERWSPSKLLSYSLGNFLTVQHSTTDKNPFWVIFGDCIELDQIKTQIFSQKRIAATFESFPKIEKSLKQSTFQFLGQYAGHLEGILYLKGLRNDTHSQLKICEQFLFICQWLQESMSYLSSPKVVVVTRGTQLVVDSDIVYNPDPSTLWGMARTLKNECRSVLLKCIDLPSKTLHRMEDHANMLIDEIFKPGAWPDCHIALREDVNERYTLKLEQVDYVSPKSDLEDKPLFKYRCSTYIITGGLSGLGFQVAEWLLENGGRHLVLVSRSNPKPEVDEKIKRWNEDGKRVFIFNADVGDVSQCTALFDWIKDMELPPVRGIIHCAGVLADAAISNQSWEKFETVFGPKVNGTWNLHKLSLFYKLDFYITFSSMSANFGVPGQLNYSAGNCYQDALIRYRHSLGLPGTTINWGNWSQVGMAANLSFPGLKSIKVSEGLKALGHIIRGNMRQLMVTTITSLNKFSKLCPIALNLVQGKNFIMPEIPAHQEIKTTPDHKLSGKEFWMEFKQANENPSKLNIIHKHVAFIVKRVLKMGQDEEIDIHSEFHKIGLDSLMLLELQSELQIYIGNQYTITSAHLRDFSSISCLSEKLLKDFLKEIV